MANIPYSEPGMAAFEQSGDFTQVELFSGSTPAPVTEDFPVAANDTFDAFSVVGVGADGNLAMATYMLGEAGEAVPATGALTFSGTGTADDTITIGDRTYTLVAADPGEDEVLIGASAAATAANLIAAINEGSDDTEPHAAVFARADAAAVVGIVAREPGVAGNAIATTETGDDTAFGAATLTGGKAEGGVKAIGVLTAAVVDVDAAQRAAIFRAGCFNPAALVWDASFDTDAKKAAAFRDAPTPTNILIRKRL